jgi:hypothetical protein
MTKMFGWGRTFGEDLNNKTSAMKTTTTYPENANKAKVILVAGLILIQASLIAGDSSDVNQNYNETNKAYSEYTAVPAILNAEMAYYNINEEAVETEYEIEDWMFDIQNDNYNAYSEEEEIELEDWMCNIQNDSFKSQQQEAEIELEEWMYNPQNSFWFNLTEAKESEPAIESWMANPDEWINTSNELVLNSK